MADKLSIEQHILCSQLKNYSPKIKTAYLGAIHALSVEDYDDRLVHFAHSLREVIDLLTRKNQTDEERKKQLNKEDRIQQLVSVIDPAGRQYYEFRFMYEQLAHKYCELSEFAHHGSELDQKNAKDILSTVEGILFGLTRPQTEILEEMDKIMLSEPSKEGALKLKSYLFRWPSHSHLLDKLSCKWLKPLDDVGFFDNPQPVLPSKEKNSDTFPYWMPSGYLAKCVDSMPDLVTDIILKYEFKTLDARNPGIYDDFLKCSLRLSENNMEKIAQKSVDENWHGFIDNYPILKKYADLAERFYLAGKYCVALEMMSHILYPKNIGAIKAYRSYEIEQILNKKIPRFAEKNPLIIAEFLVQFLKKIIGHDLESKSCDTSYTLLAAIEDHEQNNHQPNTILTICIIHLRNCLIRLGQTKPAQLKTNMNMLAEKKFYIFRKLEIFLYMTFPKLFKNEIEKVLVDFFDVFQVHHEYYHLLNSAFEKSDKVIQKQILDLIKTKSQKIFDEYKKEKDEEYANMRKRLWMLRKLEPIHDYLKEKDKVQYDKLVQEFGVPFHPDFKSYREVKIEYPVSESELFSGKTVAEVFDIVRKYKPDLDPYTMPYEDKTIASFEVFIRNNPLECSKKASEVINMDSKIQYVFLSAMEDAVDKKNVEWGYVVALIEDYIDSASSHILNIPMIDPLLESYKIIEKGLKTYQIDYGLKDRIWNLIQKFIELSNKDDDADTKYPNENTDSLTISLNNIGGVSFHVLFNYVRWCYHNEKSKDVFTKEVKKILEDYTNKNLGSHTISRHSVMGLYLPTMLDLDSEWTDSVILSKIFSSKSNKIAFWESYVSFNQIRQNMPSRLHEMYDEFLNASIAKSMYEKEFYHSTIEHATLGYLYCIKDFDEIFECFISNAESVSITHCGSFIMLILSKNPDVAKFKDKILKLWKTQSFIDHANLDMWFACKPFDKKENMRLFLNYMQHHAGKFRHLVFPLEELEEYVDEFPCDVAQCIQIFVDKPDLDHLPNMLKSILGKLLGKKMPTVDDICKKTINALVMRGYNDYRDLLQ